jgi:biopolymer transport protein ExbD
MRGRPTLKEDEEHEEAPINLTPLIDVVFVVLITFMLIAPILDIDLIHLADGGPRSRPAPPQGQQGILISVRGDNTIWFQGKKVSSQELAALLTRAKKALPWTIPQLVQDERAQFGTYQTVKNSLEAAGFEELEIILKPHQ